MINYKDIETAKDTLRRYIKECEREAIRLNSAIETNYGLEEHLSNLVTAADKLYLLSLKLQAANKIEEDDPSDMDILNNLKLPECCSVTRSEFGFEITLPPLNGKEFSLGRKVKDGKAIKYILTALLMREHDKIEKVERPILIYEHHIDEKDNLMRYMDSDNISVKVVTDALQETLIGDDNVISLYTMHIGVKDDKSFCKLNILPREKLPEWTIKNLKLF